MNYKQCFTLIMVLLMLPVFTAGESSGTMSGGNVYLTYALKVKDFDTTGSIITKSADGEINIKNSIGSILRFSVNDKDELRTYYSGIVFMFFEFSKGWLNRYKTYDKNGDLKGEDEFEDLAIVEYETRKMNLLHAKFEVLNEVDGNMEMNDAKDEIVYVKGYSSKNKLIKENYISSKEYWMANNVMYRP